MFYVRFFSDSFGVVSEVYEGDRVPPPLQWESRHVQLRSALGQKPRKANKQTRISKETPRKPKVASRRCAQTVWAKPTIGQGFSKDESTDIPPPARPTMSRLSIRPPAHFHWMNLTLFYDTARFLIYVMFHNMGLLITWLFSRFSRSRWNWKPVCFPLR